MTVTESRELEQPGRHIPRFGDAENRQQVLRRLRRGERRWWICFLTYVVVAAVAHVRYAGPTLQRELPGGDAMASAPVATLAGLLGPEQAWHPAGSHENAFFRTRLVRRLTDLGLEVDELPFVDSDLDLELVNVVARFPGKPSVRPIVLATHYDSCRFGPGAGDAGQCVAAFLETARRLASDPPEHAIWFVFTDGEERGASQTEGLRGARALLEQGDLPWGDAVPFVVSFDARGNRDAVLLYETDQANYRSMRLAARSMAHPKVTTSLMVSVYRRLPNGTDFTVYRQAGWAGWNFAVIGGAEYYHTPDDRLEKLSLKSIQHFSDHAIAAVAALDSLSDSELAELSHSAPATFFDLLGWYVVVYPSHWDWGFLGLATVLVLLAIGKTTRFRPREFGRLLLPLGAMVLLLLMLGIAGLILAWLMRVTEFLPRRFVVGGELIAQIYGVIAAVGIWQVGRCFASRWSIPELLSCLALGATCSAVALIVVFPGGAYLAIWPAVWLALHSLIRSGPHGVLAWAACLLPAILFAPTYLLLVRALGPSAGAVLTAGTSLMLMPTLVAFGDAEGRARTLNAPAVGRA